MEHETSLEKQRLVAADQARAALDVVFAHIRQQPEEIRDVNRANIAWAAAGEGLWHTFTLYEGRNTVATFIETEPEKIGDWAQQFAKAGDYTMAKSLADTFTVKEAQQGVYRAIAHQAAHAGDVPATLTLLAEAKEPEDEQAQQDHKTVISHLFYTLASQDRWEEADQLAAEEIQTNSLLIAANYAAQQGKFERVVILANQAIAQNPIMAEGRENPDGEDSLQDIIKRAAKNAFIAGNYSFIASMSTDIQWPQDAQEHWQDWITIGVVAGVNANRDFDSGVLMFIAMALDAGEDREVYQQVLAALEVRNWTAMELLSSDINSEVLGMLHRLAYQEGNVETARCFIEAIDQRDHYEGNFFIWADDAALTTLEEARKGKWRSAFELRSTLSFSDFNIAEALIKIAISQERYDVLAELAGEDHSLLSIACKVLEERGGFELAQALVDEWLSRNPEQASEDQVRQCRRSFFGGLAPAAAVLGDWPRALQALEQLDEDRVSWHRGYELVALEGLRILHFATYRQT